jgi:hypothetical protein
MNESGSPHFISSSSQAQHSLHLKEGIYFPEQKSPLRLFAHHQKSVNNFKVWRFMQADGRTNNVRPFVHARLSAAG